MTAALRHCRTCQSSIYRGNKSGYCRPCWNRSPEKLSKQSETMKAKWKDPKLRAQMTESGIRNLMNTGAQAKAAAAAKAKQTWRIATQYITAEHRERGRRTQIETKIGHIPAEVRDLYYDLTRRKKISAAEATALVLEHHETEMQRFRRKLVG